MAKTSKENKKHRKSYSNQISKSKSRKYSIFKKSSLEDNKALSNLIYKSEKSKIKCGLRRGQWSLYEDKLLKEWIRKNGPSKWEECGRFIKGRNGKQCREHWNECLNPKLVKGEWTTEEDFLIMYFYEKCHGSWKKIIHLLDGRNKNSIKNRFYCQMRKVAGEDMTIEEKKTCPKIKLEELKNNLEKAITISKNRFLNEKQLNEKEFNIYINKMELKIKKKLEEEKEYFYNKLIANLIQLKSNNTNSKDENKEDTFIKKRKITKDKNLEINIKKEKDEEEVNKINDLVENKKKTSNNNEISINENNEFKFSFEKYININNINNENINNSKEEEKKDDGDDEGSINSRKSNPFDINFIDFLPPYDEFKDSIINYKDDYYYNNLPTLDYNQMDSYSEKRIDYIEEKYMNFNKRKIDLFEK